MAMMTTLAGPLALVFGNLGRFVAGWITKIGEARIAVAALGTESVTMGEKMSAAAGAIGTANLWIAGLVIGLTALTAIMSYYSEATYKAQQNQSAFNDEMTETLRKRKDEKEQVVQTLASMQTLAEKQNRTKEEQAQFNKLADDLNRLAPDYIDKNKLYGDSLKYIADKAVLAKKGLSDAADAVDDFARRARFSALGGKGGEVAQASDKLGDLFYGEGGSSTADLTKRLQFLTQMNQGSDNRAAGAANLRDSLNSSMAGIRDAIQNGKGEQAASMIQALGGSLEGYNNGILSRAQAGKADKTDEEISKSVENEIAFLGRLEAALKLLMDKRKELDDLTKAGVFTKPTPSSSGSGSGTTRVTLKDLQEEFDAQKVLNDGIRQAIKDKQEAVAAEGVTTTAKQKKNELQIYYDSIAGTIDERNAAMDAILAKVRTFAAREYGYTKDIDELTKSIINNHNKALTGNSIALLGFIHDVDGSRIKDPNAHLNAPPDETAFIKLKTQLQLYQSLLDDFNAKYKTKKDEASDEGMLSKFLVGDGVKMKQDILDMKAAVIKTLQDIIAELVKDSPEAATLWGKIKGTTDAEGYQKFAQAILSSTALTADQQKEIALALAQLSKAQGVVPNDNASKKNQNPYTVFAENVSQMGVTNRNTLAMMQSGWSRFNSQIVAMAFGTRTSLKQVWQGIEQDFLKDVLDEIYKRYIAKGLMGFIGSIFGDPTSILKTGEDLLSGGGDDGALHGDFMVRKNGGVTSFSPDDNVIGFKHVTDLIGSILPGVVGSNFSTMPSSNVLVGSPKVDVHNRPPEVSVYIDHTLDGQKFQQKTAPRYAINTAARKVKNG
jgi:hypothetical protein